MENKKVYGNSRRKNIIQVSKFMKSFSSTNKLTSKVQNDTSGSNTEAWENGKNKDVDLLLKLGILKKSTNSLFARSTVICRERNKENNHIYNHNIEVGNIIKFNGSKAKTERNQMGYYKVNERMDTWADRLMFPKSCSPSKSDSHRYVKKGISKNNSILPDITFKTLNFGNKINFNQIFNATYYTENHKDNVIDDENIQFEELMHKMDNLLIESKINLPPMIPTEDMTNECVLASQTGSLFREINNNITYSEGVESDVENNFVIDEGEDAPIMNFQHQKEETYQTRSEKLIDESIILHPDGDFAVETKIDIRNDDEQSAVIDGAKSILELSRSPLGSKFESRNLNFPKITNETSSKKIKVDHLAKKYILCGKNNTFIEKFIVENEDSYIKSTKIADKPSFLSEKIVNSTTYSKEVECGKENNLIIAEGGDTSMMNIQHQKKVMDLRPEKKESNQNRSIKLTKESNISPMDPNLDFALEIEIDFENNNEENEDIDVAKSVNELSSFCLESKVDSKNSIVSENNNETSKKPKVNLPSKSYIFCQKNNTHIEKFTLENKHAYINQKKVIDLHPQKKRKYQTRSKKLTKERHILPMNKADLDLIVETKIYVENNAVAVLKPIIELSRSGLESKLESKNEINNETTSKKLKVDRSRKKINLCGENDKKIKKLILENEDIHMKLQQKKRSNIRKRTPKKKSSKTQISDASISENTYHPNPMLKIDPSGKAGDCAIDKLIDDLPLTHNLMTNDNEREINFDALNVNYLNGSINLCGENDEKIKKLILENEDIHMKLQQKKRSNIRKRTPKKSSKTQISGACISENNYHPNPMLKIDPSGKAGDSAIDKLIDDLPLTHNLITNDNEKEINFDASNVNYLNGLINLCGENDKKIKKLILENEDIHMKLQQKKRSNIRKRTPKKSSKTQISGACISENNYHPNPMLKIDPSGKAGDSAIDKLIEDLPLTHNLMTNDNEREINFDASNLNYLNGSINLCGENVKKIKKLILENEDIHMKLQQKKRSNIRKRTPKKKSSKTQIFDASISENNYHPNPMLKIDPSGKAGDSAIDKLIDDLPLTHTLMTNDNARGINFDASNLNYLNVFVNSSKHEKPISRGKKPSLKRKPRPHEARKSKIKPTSSSTKTIEQNIDLLDVANKITSTESGLFQQNKHCKMGELNESHVAESRKLTKKLKNKRKFDDIHSTDIQSDIKIAENVYNYSIKREWTQVESHISKGAMDQVIVQTMTIHNEEIFASDDENLAKLREYLELQLDSFESLDSEDSSNYAHCTKIIIPGLEEINIFSYRLMLAFAFIDTVKDSLCKMLNLKNVDDVTFLASMTTQEMAVKEPQLLCFKLLLKGTVDPNNIREMALLFPVEKSMKVGQCILYFCKIIPVDLSKPAMDKVLKVEFKAIDSVPENEASRLNAVNSQDQDGWDRLETVDVSQDVDGLAASKRFGEKRITEKDPSINVDNAESIKSGNTTHTEKPPYSCFYCQFTSYVFQIMEDHTIKIHFNSSAVMCGVCKSNTSPNENPTARSLCQVHSDIKSWPQQLRPDSSVAKQKDPKKRKVVYACDTCNFRGNNAKELSRHENITGHFQGDVKKCPSCYFRGTERQVKRHYSAKHKVSNFNCMFCKNVFVSIQTLNRHVTKKHPEQLS